MSEHRLIPVAVVVALMFVRQSSALVTGRIQVQVAPARGWIRNSDGGDGLSSPSSDPTQPFDKSITVQRASKNWNSTRRNNRKAITSNGESWEAKSKRELEWIVRNTEKILGEETPDVGAMSRGSIKLTRDLMGAWSRRASIREASKAPHVVERLLQRLIRERDAGNELVNIDTALYNKVLDAWANSNEEGSAERSEEILLQMEKMYREENNNAVKPNKSSYNAVIKAYVKNGNRHLSATKAEALLQRMEDQMDIAPTRRGYNLLLYAFANSKLQNAAEYSEDILHKMYHRYSEQGDRRCKPDINSYNQVISAWARGKSTGFEHRMQAIYLELLNLPKEMDVQPNADTFNAVMGGWLKSDHPSSLDIIQQVLETMEQCYALGNASAKPDRVTINTITAAYVRSDSTKGMERSMEQAVYMERKYQIMPNTVSHNIVVDSWCKSCRPDAPDHVMELLTAMENAFRKGKQNMKPDGYTYSSVIGCFNKFNRPNAHEIAEDLLVRMHELHEHHGGDPPSTSVYNSVINAWASRTDTAGGLTRVKELLQIMETNDGKDIAIPKTNRITYNTVIKAFRNGKTETAEFVEGLLSKLEEKGRTEPHLLPDVYSYTSAISAFARSECTDKAEKSFAILERMMRAAKEGNMGAVPTTHSYNAVLNACAFSQGDEIVKEKAYQIAIKTYNLLKENGAADHTTYGTLLRIFAALLPENRTRESAVNETFQKACETGNVGSLVLTQLRFASTPSQYLLLTGREATARVSVKNYPKSWTRNVRENARRVV